MFALMCYEIPDNSTWCLVAANLGNVYTREGCVHMVCHCLLNT